MDRFLRYLEARTGVILTAAGGLLLAVVLGITIGQGAFLPALVLLGASVVLVMILRMRSYIWLLIPIGWYITGRLGFLPLPLSVRDLCVLLPAAMFIVFVAMRRPSLNAPVTALDLVLFLNLSYVIIVYVRHPVGASAFGSAMVGGRPYFDILIAFLAYFVLVRTFVAPQLARRIPFLTAMPQIFLSLLGLVAYVVPSVGPAISLVYGGLDMANMTLDRDYEPGAGGDDLLRITDLSLGAKAGAQALLSYFSLGSLMNPARLGPALGFFACFVAMGLAGYRNGIFYLVSIVALSTLIRGGMSAMLRAALVLAVFMAMMAGLQNAGVHLPTTIQRSLSFLPADWDPEAKSDAEGSTEWRVYMWQQAITTNTLIKDKLFGDGFGFSAYELSIMQGDTGYIGYERQELWMIQGAFHSGPLSTVRFVGVIGLALYLALLGFSAVWAGRLLRMTKGSPYLPIAIFVALPVIYEPIQYVFIFGAYDSGFPNTIFLCGMIRLVENSWRRWHATEGRSAAQEALPVLASA